MSYEVSVREVGPVKAMTLRMVTHMKTISDDMGKAYEALWQYMEKSGAQCAGECFALYHDEDFNPEHIDVECGFSVVDLMPGTDKIKGRTVEGGLMAYALHKGPYDQLEGVYPAIMKWVEANGYALLPKMRELYLNNPCEVPPEELMTEVLWPVKKK